MSARDRLLTKYLNHDSNKVGPALLSRAAGIITLLEAEGLDVYDVHIVDSKIQLRAQNPKLPYRTGGGRFATIDVTESEGFRVVGAYEVVLSKSPVVQSYTQGNLLEEAVVNDVAVFLRTASHPFWKVRYHVEFIASDLWCDKPYEVYVFMALGQVHFTCEPVDKTIEESVVGKIGEKGQLTFDVRGFSVVTLGHITGTLGRLLQVALMGAAKIYGPGGYFESPQLSRVREIEVASNA